MLSYDDLEVMADIVNNAGLLCDDTKGVHSAMWGEEEDRTLEALIEQYGFQWRCISSKMQGRSESAMRNRYARIHRKDAVRVVLTGVTPYTARN